MPAFDGVELVRWAETYGHPEEWAKKAQQAHNRAEAAEERLALNRERLQQAIRTRPGYEDFVGSPESAVGIAAEMIEGTR